jgi:hypothetical protein
MNVQDNHRKMTFIFVRRKVKSLVFFSFSVHSLEKLRHCIIPRLAPPHIQKFQTAWLHCGCKVTFQPLPFDPGVAGSKCNFFGVSRRMWVERAK